MMSGTSLDGIDVAIVDIQGRPRGDRLASLRFECVAFRSIPYPKNVRAALLGVSNTMTHTAAISRLNFLLGELYAEALIETCRRKRIPLKTVDLIGMHGQTIYHEGEPAEYLGRRVASTLQIGESAVVAERTGIWTVSNFRERDIAAGGRGAPLIPFVDYFLFKHRHRNRVALNLGGIANITVLPAAAKLDDVVAFDTGPGNMVIDALVAHMTEGRETFDRNGRIARGGKIHAGLLDSMTSDPYLKRLGPKTAGREQFGQQFVSGLIATGIPLPDLIATATEFTVHAAVYQIYRSIEPDEIIVSGGGIHNAFLMRRLRANIDASEIVKSSAEFGIDPDAKEAIAFAVLAYESFDRRAASLPSATGARHPVVLGKNTVAH
jgi:anhydro-N-acetylmuramic acid kinase